MSDRTLRILRDLQQELNLTDENIISITNRVLQKSSFQSVDAKPSYIPPQSLPLSLQAFTFNIITIDSTGRQTDCRAGEAYSFTENIDNELVLEMVYIPEGSFLMGSPRVEGRESKAKPQHSVTIKPFLISRNPITKAQWEVIAPLPKAIQGKDLSSGCPIVQVSWYDAIEFCTQLSQRTGRNSG